MILGHCDKAYFCFKQRKVQYKEKEKSTKKRIYIYIYIYVYINRYDK